MKKRHFPLYVTAVCAILAACLTLALPGHIKLMFLFEAAFSCLYAVLLFIRKKERRRYCVYAAAAAALTSVTYCLVPDMPCLYAARAAALALFLMESFLVLKETADIWRYTFIDEKITYLGRILSALAVCFFIGLFTVYEIHPEKFLTHMAAEKLPQELPEKYAAKYTVTYDIRFSDAYPLSTFDLILPQEGNRGTAVLVSSTGYISEDLNRGRERTLFTNLLEEGYAVVTLNYDLPLTSSHPALIEQADGLIMYITENAGEYGIDADHIILAGSGCGADAVLQYALCAVDPEYAEKNGLSVSMDSSRIRCLYLCSALYRPQYGAETGLLLSDYIRAAHVRNYYGVSDLLSSKKLKDLDVFPYIRDGFVPVFFSDGNTGTYNRQAHAFEELLSGTNILYEGHVFDDAKDGKDLVSMSFDEERNHFTNAVNGTFLAFLRSVQDE